ncbi:hypothetical protein BD769DRAFT_1412950, partial [Suillus cothurnatus]
TYVFLSLRMVLGSLQLVQGLHLYMHFLCSMLWSCSTLVSPVTCSTVRFKSEYLATKRILRENLEVRKFCLSRSVCPHHPINYDYATDRLTGHAHVCLVSNRPQGHIIREVELPAVMPKVAQILKNNVRDFGGVPRRSGQLNEGRTVISNFPV